MAEEEIWRKVAGFSNYSVSNLGFLINDITGAFIGGRPQTNGYIQVAIINDSGIKKYKLLHRLVATAFCENDFDHPTVDHIDGNKQNNHFSNLRFASLSQNNRNKKKRVNKSSKYIGVYFDKSRNKWKATIRIEKNIHLGYFNTEEDAYDVFKQTVFNNNLQAYYPPL